LIIGHSLVWHFFSQNYSYNNTLRFGTSYAEHAV